MQSSHFLEELLWKDLREGTSVAHFSSNKKAILAPKDAEGQKFRIMSSHVLEAQFKAVGANPQVLPFSEVYSALQQGVVDGAENPLSNFYTKKFNEVHTD